MKYKDLPTDIKRKVNGSLSSVVRSAGDMDTVEELFSDWFTRKVYQPTEGETFYSLNRSFYEEEIDLKDFYKIDAEFLDDARQIITERLEKKIAKAKETFKKIAEKMQQEEATEKQIKFANKLMKKLTGEKNYFKDTKLSKFEIGQKIEDLLEEVYQKNKEEGGKVILFPKKR